MHGEEPGRTFEKDFPASFLRDTAPALDMREAVSRAMQCGLLPGQWYAHGMEGKAYVYVQPYYEPGSMRALVTVQTI